MNNRKLVWALIVLNVVLAAAFVGRIVPANTAQAQVVRRPGDYVLIPAEVQGGQAGVVFIVDTTNGELSAIALDEASKKLVAMPRLNLADVFTGAAGGAMTPSAPKHR